MRQRQHARAAASLWVLTQGDRRRLGTTRDISVGGLFVNTSEQMAVGQQLALTVVDGAQSIAVTGTTCRREAEGVAVVFDRLPDATLRLLQQTIDRHIVALGPTSERRRRSRVIIEQPMVWWVEGQPRQKGVMRNLCLDGALIETAGRPELGASIFVLLQVEPSPRQCVATVRHRCDDAMGVEFVAPTPEFDAVIEQLLLAHAQLGTP